MTPAPSSPDPAGEAERPTWWPEIVETVARRLCSDAGDDPDGLSNVTVEHRDGHTTSGTFSRTWKLWVEQADALLSTPTPGRAAEPDTMAEVERLTRERDEARADAERAEAERDELRDAPWPKWVTDCLTIIRKHSGYDGYDDAVQGIDLPAELEETLNESVTRAETAEAQLATLRARIEQNLVAIERQVKITCDFDRNETAAKKADPVATTVEISLSHVTDAVARIRALLSNPKAGR